MNNEKLQFLNQRVLPRRLTIIETGWLLAFTPRDISILIGFKMLTPMGKPAQNSTKYFATVQIEALKDDVDWLDKATGLLKPVLAGQKRRKKEGRTRPMTTPVLLSERVVVTPREFASLFGRHYTWAYRQIYAGNIKVISKLGRMMIPSSEVDRLLQQKETYRGEESKKKK